MKKTKEMMFGFLIFLSVYIIFISQSQVVFSAPVNTSNITAQGGNVTFLSIFSTSKQTVYWQGYFGSVGGGIVLEDANGYNFYDWSLETAVGEILAARHFVQDWSKVNCTNMTQLTAEEDSLSIPNDDDESINKTFNATDHPSFQISGRTMVNCRSTKTDNSTDSNAVFWNVLLSVNDTSTIYTAIMDNNQVGYNGSIVDFQLLVPVNASTNSAVYNIYVELG